MGGTESTLIRYRPLLHLHVRQLQLGRLFQARFDASDIVQESLLRAVRAWDQVAVKEEAEQVRWLLTIVRNVLVDFVREQGAAKRNPRLEQTVSEAAEDWDTPLVAYLTASEQGPSTLLMRQEALILLAAAVDQLPEAERDAVISHYILELPLADIAIRLDRSERGVAGLLFRGKRRLRELLSDAEEQS